MANSLSHSILKTLAYYDVFSFPLTIEELFHALWEPPLGITFQETLTVASVLKDEGRLQSHYGYYYLPGQAAIVEERRRAVLRVEEKMDIARRAMTKMRYVPFVRSVMVCNTVAFGWPHVESDVDVFIIVQSGRLWLTRVLITLGLGMVRLRRGKRFVTDRVCLSFYVTTEALDLSKVALAPPDIYLAYWITHLIPLFNSHQTYEQFTKANQWVLTHLPTARLDYDVLPRVRVNHSSVSRAVQQVGEWIFGRAKMGDWIERMVKKIQQTKMARNRHSLQHEPDTRVVISDDMLKFHENDRRELYRQKWKERVKEFEPLNKF